MTTPYVIAAVVASPFVLAGLVKAYQRQTPRGYTPLPPLGESIQPMSLQPLGSIWRAKRETDL